MSLQGEVIFLFVNDLGKEFGKAKLIQLFRNTQELTISEPERSFPEEISPYNTPLIIGLKKRELQYKNRNYSIKTEAAFYDIGAISIRIRVNFESDDMLETFAFDETFEKQIDEVYRHTLSFVLSKLNLDKSSIAEEMEQYRVYIIKQKYEGIKESFLAGLLLQEREYESLSKEYIISTLSKKLSYDKDEAIFVDWDGMIIIRESGECEHEVLVAEIANVQLLELRIYSRKTIDFVKLMEKEINALKTINILNFFSANKKVYDMTIEIVEYREETQGMLNEVDNIIAGFGDWYLAKLYALFSERFRLKDWKANITENLSALDSLRSILETRLANQFSIVTEVAIILLFIFEVALELLMIIKL